MDFIIGWLVLTAIVAFVIGIRSGVRLDLLIYCVLCIVVGLVAGVIAHRKMKKPRENEHLFTNARRCPHCRELIDKALERCSYCDKPVKPQVKG